MPSIALTFSNSVGSAAISTKDLGTVSINPLAPTQQTTSVTTVHVRHNGTQPITNVQLYLADQAAGGSNVAGKDTIMNTWTSGTGSSWGGLKAQRGGTDLLSSLGELVRENGAAWVFDADHGDANTPATWIAAPDLAAGASMNVNLQAVVPDTELIARTYGVRLGVRYTYTS